MSTIKNLAALRRERVGKGAARAVRNEGRVPAVIYGAGQPPVSISLNFKETNKLIYAGHFLTTVFSIDVEGEIIRAVPRDYQLDVVKDFPMHVDFLRLGEGATIRIDVPVHVSGQDVSPGLKKGGSLNIVSHSVSMQVLADNIPDALNVDISTLDVNGTIHISQIPLPAGAKVIAHEKDATILSISGPKAA